MNLWNKRTKAGRSGMTALVLALWVLALGASVLPCSQAWATKGGACRCCQRGTASADSPGISGGQRSCCSVSPGPVASPPSTGAVGAPRPEPPPFFVLAPIGGANVAPASGFLPASFWKLPPPGALPSHTILRI